MDKFLAARRLVGIVDRALVEKTKIWDGSTALLRVKKSLMLYAGHGGRCGLE